MPGFFVLKNNEWSGGFGLPEYRFLNESTCFEDIIAFRSTLRKFEADKVFENSDDLIMILDGVVLNKQDLFKKYDVSCISELIRKLYSTREDFFSEFRGPFCGALYDKKKRCFVIFTNQTGEKAVYYRYDNNSFAAGTNLGLLCDISRNNGRSITPDENAAYMLLTFGVMEDNSTLASQIKRLRGGTYLCIDESGLEIKEYHKFTKHPERFKNTSEDELIDLIEKAFSKAVISQFEKDREYGYRHLCDLSGGLDSRMDMWTAHDNGYNDLTLINYGKADYLDEMIAKKISLYWKDDLIIMPTDNLRFLNDIDRIVDMNGATSYYAGITGGVRMLEKLNMQPFGLEHSGLIGEVVLGSHMGLNTDEDINNRVHSGMQSARCAQRLCDNTEYHDSFFDHEVYLRYVTEFQGDANSVQLRNYYTEVCSPFLDVELLQLCFDIPVKMRANHGIYIKWILKKHRKAADFKWERINGYIYEGEKKLLARKAVYKGPHKAARMLGLEKYSPLSMNPFDHWILKDRDARRTMIEHFKSDFRSSAHMLSPQLKNDLKELFCKGTAFERLSALTVLAGVCRLYGKRE